MIKEKFATRSRIGDSKTNLLLIKDERYSHHTLEELPSLLPVNSLLVVNTAATLPARLEGRIGSTLVELRLVHNISSNQTDIRIWKALVYTEGSWRQRTEDREGLKSLELGDIIDIHHLRARIVDIHHDSKKLVTIEFLGEMQSIWNKIYTYGKPIQYSHLTEELELWDIQTIFSSVPVGVEPPSASFQFTWDIINQVISKGIEIVGITHATSVSSTGEEDLDKQLPFDERYWIDEEVAEIINFYRETGRPIIALGTSVTRALEDNMTKYSEIRAGTFIANLKITGNYRRKIVSALFTGMHLPKETHVELLHSFIQEKILQQAYFDAKQQNYLWHEYGDVNLIL